MLCIRRRSIFLYKCSEIRYGKESNAEKLTQHHTRDYKLHAETRFALHCKSTVRRKAFQQQPNKKKPRRLFRYLAESGRANASRRNMHGF